MSTQEDTAPLPAAEIDRAHLPTVVVPQNAMTGVELIIQDATQNMPLAPDERFLQGRIFDTRIRLVRQLMQDSLVPQEKNQNTDHEDISLSQEELWRDMLPPLLLPPVRKVTHFSAWRSALLAILGLILGFALGQALLSVGLFDAVFLPGTENATQSTQSTSLTIICGLIGVMGALWSAEYFITAMRRNSIQIFGSRYHWKPFTRLASLVWVGALALALARDIFSGQLGPLHMVQMVGHFLTSGQALPFFNNIYGVLLFTFLFALFLKRPLHFDQQDFEEKLSMAAHQWWAGASRIGPLLFENIQLKNDPSKDAWKKVGSELYSLAGELPEARQQWLEERLRRLGIEVTREQGKLVWSEEMTDRYTPLGHITWGDACYVDEPPILEQGILVRKGTVRKVRK